MVREIKAASDCRALYRRFWPGLYREHGNSSAYCHEDSTESLQLSKDFAYCHACGTSLDCLDLYQAGAGVEKKEAIKLMASELGLDSAPVRASRKSNTRHKPPKAFIDRWRALLKNKIPEEAVGYLEKTRSIPGVVEELRGGRKIAFDGNYPAGKNEHWSVLAFPLVDAGQKEMTGIQYVSIAGLGKKFASGTNGKDSFFFVGTGKEYCVITGAVIDALSAYHACRSNLDIESISILSESKGYSEKLKQLHRTAPVIFFDNDDAGRQATDQAVKVLEGNCRVVDWSLAPSGMKDVNDLLRAGHADVIERMVRTSRVPTEKEVRDLDSDEDLINRKIEELNRHHAVVMVGGRCVVINETLDPAFGGTSVTYSSVDDFRNCYRNQKVWVPCGEGKTKQVDVGKVWLDSEQRRQYKGVTFYPGASSNGYYNLFRGFAVEPRKGDWNLFRDHIYNVIAGGNEERFSYLIAWMAHTIQHCGDFRPGVTIVLRGGQGSGKGCFATIFGNLFGSHFKHITQARQLTGNFNDHLKNAVVVFVDEGFWAGDKQSEGALKAMISEDRIAVEPKGKDVFYVRNFIRIIIASNNRWVVPAGLGDRRFFVVDVSPRHVQDHHYFKVIFGQMESGGYSAMMHDLQQIDISGFNLFEYPKTEALFDQIHQSMSPTQKFWYEKLRSYSVHDDFSRFPTYISTASFYEDYIEFCRKIGERHPASNRSFVIELKRMCPGIVRVRRSTDNGREWSIELPDLGEARIRFQEFVGKAPVDWDDEAEGNPMPRDGPFSNKNAGLSHLSH